MNHAASPPWRAEWLCRARHERPAARLPKQAKADEARRIARNIARLLWLLRKAEQQN
jgi:hypothetical protein